MSRAGVTTAKVSAATALVIAGATIRRTMLKTGVTRTSIYRELKRLGYRKDGGKWVNPRQDCAPASAPAPDSSAQP